MFSKIFYKLQLTILSNNWLLVPIPDYPIVPHIQTETKTERKVSWGILQLKGQTHSYHQSSWNSGLSSRVHRSLNKLIKFTNTKAVVPHQTLYYEVIQHASLTVHHKPFCKHLLFSCAIWIPVTSFNTFTYSSGNSLPWKAFQSFLEYVCEYYKYS